MSINTTILIDCVGAPRSQDARSRLQSVLPEDARDAAWRSLPDVLTEVSGNKEAGAEPCLVLVELARDALVAAMEEGRPPRAALAAWMKAARDTLSLCETMGNARVVTLRQAESDPGILNEAARHFEVTLSAETVPPGQSVPNDPVMNALAQTALSLERRARELNAELIKVALVDDPVRRTDRPDPDRAFKAYRALAEGGAVEARDGSDAGTAGASPQTPATAPAPAYSTVAPVPPVPDPGPMLPPEEGDYRVRFRPPVSDSLLAARLAEAEARNEVLIDQVAQLQEALHRAVIDPVTLAFEAIFCDEAFNHPAFYGTERRNRDALPFRWFGREREAAIRTTVPGVRPVCVEAHVAVAINKPALEGFAIALPDAAPVGQELTQLDDGTFLVRAFFEEASADPLTRLTVILRAGNLVDLSDKGDARTLAVGIHKITVSQLEELPAEHRANRRMVEMPAHAALSLPAFYGAEELDGVPFRWMGRENEEVLRTDIACRGTMAVDVHMPVVLSPACVEAMTLSLNGLAPTRQTVEPVGDGVVVSAFFEAMAGSEPGATVILSAPEKIAMSGSDGRTLSVAIHKVVVRAAEGENAAPDAAEPPADTPPQESAG